jgi:hypothetical protein
MASRISVPQSALLPTVPDGACASLAPAADPTAPRSNRRPEPVQEPFLNFVRYLKGDRDALGATSYPLARQRAETALLATDRVLALLCRIEANADQRADNDVAAVAKLQAIRDLARGAISAHTGAPFDNPLFPVRSPPR